MDSSRFDALARTLAGRPWLSRRRLIERVAGGSVAAAMVAGIAASASAQGNGKDKGSSCREAGHPCEGNQVCCEGLVCGPSGPGKASRCGAPDATTAAATTATAAAAPTVAPVAAYRVDVTCAYDQQGDRSTCTCTGVAPAGAPAIRSIAVASAAVCAEVVGGDSALGTPGPALGSAGFTSTTGQATLTLILTGKVVTGGSATYWCMTDAGTVPATGLGLIRQQTDVSDTLGAIDVRVASCDIAAPGPAGYDWHGQCAQPAAGAQFALKPASGAVGSAASGTASSTADGRVVFGQLQPGAYALSQTGANWCHAESDGTDSQGHIVVKAGQRTTVWIFDCTQGGS